MIENVVGTDAGILKYARDTDGMADESLNLSDERGRLEREQRSLSCLFQMEEISFGDRLCKSDV